MIINNNINIGTNWISIFIFNSISTIGIIIVIIDNNISIFNPIFFNIIFIFLFAIIEVEYNPKLIIFELNILYKPVFIKPVNAEKETVNNSGIDVANPDIFPIVLELKLSTSANFLIYLTNTYLHITTIKKVYINNFNTSNIKTNYSHLY